MRYSQAQLEAALEYGIDTQARIVFLHGDVEEQTVAQAIRGLYVLNTVSKEPVELYVSSYGGNVDDTFALHDVTRTIACPIHTVALGKCMSAAPLLVACGKPGERYAAENTVFMLHDTLLTEIDGRPRQLKVLAELEERRSKVYCKLLEKYTKMPYAHWWKLSTSDTDKFFTADEALKWGLVDSMWAEKE